MIALPEMKWSFRGDDGWKEYGPAVGVALDKTKCYEGTTDGLVRKYWELADFLCRLRFAFSVHSAWLAGTLLKVVTTYSQSR